MILKQDENLNFKHEIFLIQIKIFVRFCSIINPLQNVKTMKTKQKYLKTIKLQFFTRLCFSKMSLINI